MRWLKENAPSIEALAALITALVAVAALIGVKLQLDANANLQATQSARDIFREHLTLSIANPEFANPDVCALVTSEQAPAYNAFVEHLLYTSEQILATQSDWDAAIAERIAPHTQYFCTSDDWQGYTTDVSNLISDIRAQHCGSAFSCQ